MKPHITVVIINYNTQKLLHSCLTSLKQQTWPNMNIIFIDNDSKDGSCEYVQKNWPDVTAVCNKENIGYAPAGNQGINMAEGDYVMLLNPDIKFEPDYIEKCLHKMQSSPKIAAIGGKLYRYNFEKNEKTNIMDTVGLFCFRNRRVIDDGQGLEDKGQFNEEKEVFGISGACPIYRREALEDAKIEGEYLDENFFMYKEDVDISWRFHLLGWTCWYYPKAVAHHGRGTGVLKRFTHMEVYKNRSKLHQLAKYHSYKNQRLMQLKNEQFTNVLADFFPLLWKEILVTLYMIFREPFLWKSFGEMCSKIPSTLKKRRAIMKKRRASAKEMRRWISGKQSEYLQYDKTH